MTPLQLVCVVVLMSGATLASVVVHRPCEELPANVCTIEQVRIDPCSDPKSCRLKKGHPASISFDYTPNFSANSLKTGLFWASDSGDVPFPDLYEADGCPLTSCPVESGKTQDLTYSIKLSKLLPQGTYEFKYKLWSAEDENNVCCFKTTVQLRR